MWNQTDADLAQQRTITVICKMLMENAGIDSAVQLGRTAVNSCVQVNKCKYAHSQAHIPSGSSADACLGLLLFYHRSVQIAHQITRIRVKVP